MTNLAELPPIPFSPQSVKIGSIKLSMIEHPKHLKTGVPLNSVDGCDYISNMVTQQVKHGFMVHGCVNPTFMVYVAGECDCHDLIVIGGGELGTPINELTDLARSIVKDCAAFCVVTLGEIRKHKSSNTRNQKTVVNYQEAVCIQIEHLFSDKKLIADFNRYEVVRFGDNGIGGGVGENGGFIGNGGVSNKWSMNPFVEQKNKTPVVSCIENILEDSLMYKMIEVV